MFCRVIDNYGDIGVCWRLARQLCGEYGQQVTLWVDDLVAFGHIARVVADADEQVLEGVRVCHWRPDARPADTSDIVIEAFGCELPDSQQVAMRTRTTAPVWLNLEYLSAEDWVASCHGLASPQGGGLNKYFFFPGFAAGTGGVLAERSQLAARATWQTRDRTSWLAGLGVKQPDALTISLFGYENDAITRLIEQLCGSGELINVLVPVGRVLPQVASAIGQGVLTPGQHVQRDALNIYVVPMLPQADYDHMLWSSDLNFVRGEDSFVRAQHAMHPFVWHIYPQDDAAHETKLLAFVDQYTLGWPEEDAKALRAFWLAWNRGDLAPGQWAALRALLPQWQLRARAWSAHLDSLGNLAGNLVKFAKTKLK
ncbi:hypothetical protein GCM10010971_36900 [Silvimonas amylolytica]|uniref:Protein-arginine rhamnosyltransferase n=1 Tax=Silvimonas amylolytica TaxID=449663 RepID=A0ABQ2PRA3_9NEIS|nr:hypothetical protein GCM10010971_36900 [Silvimonas amylolytica]